ncbi:MAG: hypothetical protein OHK005_11190 [Candidatus Methylacidiphilales bacterium]
MVVFGRTVFALLFLGLGLLYFRAVTFMQKEPGTVSIGKLCLYLAGPWMIFLAGWPYVSPDVFYYLGKGWMESGYGMDVFRQSLEDVPDLHDQPLFFNVHPAFWDNVGNYGPAFQILCAGVAWLGQGDIRLSLLIFKIVCAVALAVCGFYVYRLACVNNQPPAMAVFCLLASPLILFSFLTCTHNDVFLALGMLMALWRTHRRCPLSCGIILGTIFSIKYISLMVTPLFGLYFLKDRIKPLRNAFMFSVAFLGSAILFHWFKPGSWDLVTDFAGKGYSTGRNSLTIFLLPFLQGFGVDEAFSLIKRTVQLAFFFWAPAVALYWALAPRMNVLDLVRSMVALYLFYLVLTAQFVQEWYLIWVWPLAAVLPGSWSMNWMKGLGLFYMLGVIFTMGNPPLISLTAQAYLYAALVLVSVPWLCSRELFPFSWGDVREQMAVMRKTVVGRSGGFGKV